MVSLPDVTSAVSFLDSSPMYAGLDDCDVFAVIIIICPL